ncbi:MAG: ExeA family protein [Planctomycetota bacterium]
MDGMVMYDSHFGLHRQPFQCAELMRAFFVSESIRSIVPQLLHALRSDLGIAVLTGPVGVGKTTFLRHLQSTLSSEGRTILCSAASLESPLNVLQTLHTSLNVRAAQRVAIEVVGRDMTQSRWTLLDQLQRTSELWGPILLLIDDAQLLSVPVLNELRAFSEEEWNGRSLIRCLIAGPLSLEEELARPTHSDFGHRIRCHAFLQPLTIRESSELLGRHIEAVGGQLHRIFTSSALELIASACDGLPRCLSLLADETLVIAAERNCNPADEECVRFALSRLQHLPYSWSASPLPVNQQSLARETEELPTKRSTYLDLGDPAIITTTPGVIEFGAGPALTTHRTVGIGGSSAASISSDVEIRNESPVPDYFAEGSRLQQSSSENVEAEFELKEMLREPSEETSFHESEAEDSGRKMNSGYAISWRNLESSFSVTEFCVPPVEDALQASTSCSGQPDFLSADFDVENSSSGRVEGNSSSVISETLEISERADDRQEDRQTDFRFSERLPVFDRYTWVALGRDVPSGSHAVRSSSHSHRAVYENSVLKSTCQQLADVRSFDHIPIHAISADEIGRRLCPSTSSAALESSLANGVSGHASEFFRRATEVLGNSPATTPVVGVEFFNPPGLPAIQESVDAVIPFEPIQSIENRRAIRDAILSRLTEVDGLKSTHDLEDLVDSAISTFDAEKMSTRDESPWMDGHLVFERGDQVQRRDEMATNPWSIKSALDSESEILANNALADDREFQNRGTFFTLPPHVGAIKWDLRSEIIETDDFLPIAQSLSELKGEVSAFQQGSPEDDSNRWSKQRTHQLASSGGSESVIVQARQRVEDLSTVVSGDASQKLEPQTGPDELVEGRWMIAAEHPVIPSLPKDDTTPTSFGQLFTRLRHKKRASEEV